MADLFAVIGGSGFYQLDEQFRVDTSVRAKTPYGQTSAELQVGDWHGIKLAFLPRHGVAHQVPPHRINYRANLWALNEIGVRNIISVNAVGGIGSQYAPQVIALPDQIIDYTCNREHSFFEEGQDEVRHIDFTWPYSSGLRAMINQAALAKSISLVDGGTYGCTNGPRLETAAEIRKLRADGCDLVGMTGMPEAALAREMEIEYASIAMVVNWCAGLDDGPISMNEIQRVMKKCVFTIRELILTTLEQIKS